MTTETCYKCGKPVQTGGTFKLGDPDAGFVWADINMGGAAASCTPIMKSFHPRCSPFFRSDVKDARIAELEAQLAQERERAEKAEAALKPFADWASIIKDALKTGEIKAAELYPISVQESELWRAYDVLSQTKEVG